MDDVGRSQRVDKRKAAKKKGSSGLATREIGARVGRRRGSGAQPANRSADRPVVAGIAISHPERPIFSDLGISKLDFARYFDGIAEWIVPHVAGRPLTLVHCPRGAGGDCSFMKHAKAWGPTALRRVHIQEKKKVGEYLVADNAIAVVALAQMGIVEIHTWNATADDVERPNRIVWDLDPGPAVNGTATVAAARLLQSVLQTLGL